MKNHHPRDYNHNKYLIVLFTNIYFLISIYVVYQLNLFLEFQKRQADKQSNLIGRLVDEQHHWSNAPAIEKKETRLPASVAAKDFSKDEKQDGPIPFMPVDSTSERFGRNQESVARNGIFGLNHTHTDGGSTYYPPPVGRDVARKNPLGQFRIAQRARYGEHRPNKNAVMAFAYGYQLPQIIHFTTSLWKTGYDGDLVIGVGTNLTAETRSYLEESARARPGLVVYEIPLSCARKDSCKVVDLIEQVYINTETKKMKKSTPDARPYRRVSVLRYEYYWAWTTKYNAQSLIFIADVRDVYFQLDPIRTYLAGSSNYEGTLVFFEEAVKFKESRANSKWIEKTYSSQLKDELAEKMVVCSGSTLGSQAAVETYARAMVHEFDNTECRHCANKHDQCFHNYLIHQDRLVGANDRRISKVVVHAQGRGGIVNTVGKVSEVNGGKTLGELGLVQNETHTILENDRQTVSAVVHMYDRDGTLKNWVDLQTQQELLDYRMSKAKVQ